MSKISPAEEDANSSEASEQPDEPDGSVPGYSTLILQQGVQQLKQELRPLASYVDQLDL